MGFAISVKALGSTSARLRAYWDRFARFEQTPSMAALAYPPHVTLAVYERIHEDQLRAALRRVFKDVSAISLRFTALCRFEQPALVFWAAPEPCESLSRVHAAIHKLIDPALCEAHYRPSNWVPHCTLATRVVEANKAVAITSANEPIDAFEVTFDWADCVQFSPVRVIEEINLSPWLSDQ
ncbi:MAG: 2'-5' RNA ligase family protein [Xanthobacteraceae bacterium]|nr:2'-5' RNA ligase family protein [Xanthobacteraceae bacterium]